MSTLIHPCTGSALPDFAWWQFVTWFDVAVFVVGLIALSVVVTGIVRRIALRLHVIDRPSSTKEGRKQHARPTPLWGGLAIYLVFCGALAMASTDVLPSFYETSPILLKHVWGLMLGGLILMIGGMIDDKYDLKPWIQIVFPVAAAGVVIASGLGFTFLANPFGTGLDLTVWQIDVFTWNGDAYQLTPLADLFTFVWILVAVYATKMLDGLDGLVSGITVVSGVALFVLSLLLETQQPATAYIALSLAAATAGFLVWNGPFPQAKIFLGEGGSTFLGFVLAVLAIISGVKIGAVLLLLGLPLVDMMIVIVRRMLARQSPFQGDRRHIHFRLQMVFEHARRQRASAYAVYSMWGIVAVFGLAAVLFEGKTKALLLLVLVLVTTVLAIRLPKRENHIDE